MKQFIDMKHPQLFKLLLSITLIASIFSCNKLDEFTQGPEIQPLRQGFQACAAVGYCASLASAAFQGEPLPDNVTFESSTRDGYSSAGVLHVHVSTDHPVPFNTGTGDIYIAGLWDNTSGGVISIIFADINLIDPKFYGLYTVPVIKKETGEVISVFAQQDLVIGEGSDTLLNLSLSKPKFSTELDRLNNPHPADAFAAIKQNVWFISANQNGTLSNVYDDDFEINGGGQIIEARSNSGGILYHAMIETKFNYNTCASNPTNGIAFIQNLKASGSSVDLGNLTLNFHSKCDGRASVTVATGKYVTANGKTVSLGF
jgi:hypothetical protein